MGSFNPNDYETVKDRITRFYADHADGRIITDLVNTPDSLPSFAAFRASVYIGDILKATGYAMEQQGQNGVNKDAWAENAETSAIGRALANMDYCGDKRASREEMQKVSDKPNPAELANLKTALIDFQSAGVFEESEARRLAVVMAANDIPAMKKALDVAKKRNAER